MKLIDIAHLVNGEVIGNPDIEITGVSGLSHAAEGDITFLSTGKLARECAESRAACVMVREEMPGLEKPQLKVGNPLYAFAKLLEYFHPVPQEKPGISDNACVSDTARIGKDAVIYPMAFIADGASIGDNTVIHAGVFVGSNSSVGDRCILYPNVTVRENVKIGSRAIIHSGAVIGSDGFGYVFENSIHNKIPQVGGVIIGDNVEIGANVTIDRATTGNTIIGSGSKIDNLVQIAHNVKIGQNSIIVAQVGVGGSTEIGNFVMIGGQVGIADHARIDDACMIGAQSGVMGHLPRGNYSGSPVIPHRDWLRASVFFARLPELHRKIIELENKIKDLEGRQHHGH